MNAAILQLSCSYLAAILEGLMAWIVGFISQKGGVGKSTESRALAREATSCGIKTNLRI